MSPGSLGFPSAVADCEMDNLTAQVFSSDVACDLTDAQLEAKYTRFSDEELWRRSINFERVVQNKPTEKGWAELARFKAEILRRETAKKSAVKRWVDMNQRKVNWHGRYHHQWQWQWQSSPPSRKRGRSTLAGDAAWATDSDGGGDESKEGGGLGATLATNARGAQQAQQAQSQRQLQQQAQQGALQQRARIPRTTTNGAAAAAASSSSAAATVAPLPLLQQQQQQPGSAAAAVAAVAPGVAPTAPSLMGARAGGAIASLQQHSTILSLQQALLLKLREAQEALAGTPASEEETISRRLRVLQEVLETIAKLQRV